MISVLYIDDEPELLELGKTFLERSGNFSITIAESGSTALDLLKTGDFEAIISDFQMPEMDGITLLRRIRAISDIPFILFTGKGREEVVINAINNGRIFTSRRVAIRVPSSRNSAIKSSRLYPVNGLNMP
jgi:CheY-like chemotaxis protein